METGRAARSETQKKVEELLKRGLEHYGRSEREVAIACWREVLALRPDEERAIDYLQGAGEKPLPERPEPMVDVESAQRQITSRSHGATPAMRGASSNEDRVDIFFEGRLAA